MKIRQRAMRNPTVVVTGAAGFIGRQLVRHLARRKVRVWAVDRMPPPEGFWPRAIPFQRADIAADGHWLPTDLPQAPVLVHLAWNLDRNDSALQSAALRDFTRLLDQAARAGIQRIIGMGTAEEYGNREGALKEDQAPGEQLSAYGKAKYEAGKTLAAWCGAESGRKAFWLRPFVVYGPRQGGDMVIPYALRCALEKRLATFTAGEQLRDFIHVEDVVRGILCALEALETREEPWTVCNLGRGEPVRLRDVLDMIARQTGATDRFHFGVRPMRPGEPQAQYADLTRAREILAWKATIPWQRGVAQLCREAGP